VIFNLDQAVDIAESTEKREAWELTITIGGVDHPVRRIESDEASEIGAALLSGNALAFRKIATGIFEEPKPDVSGWNDMKLATALGMVAQYLSDRKSLAFDQATAFVRMQLKAQRQD
jgi:hypothetical protein